MAAVAEALFFGLHSISHVCLYLVPRYLTKALVTMPITLLESLAGDQRTFPENDALITVVAHWWDKTTLKRFGLVEEGMVYPCPLYNGHLQTILGVFRMVKPVIYRRVQVPAADGCPLCVDWALSTSTTDAPKGIMIVLPGLTSSSESSYVRQFVRSANREGFHCAVSNARGVGDTPITTNQLMSAVFTCDLRTLLQGTTLTSSAAAAGVLSPSDVGLPVFAIGFSLGGAILCNYLCEEGEAMLGITNKSNKSQSSWRKLPHHGGDGASSQAVLTAAFSVCAPWDMHDSALNMMRPTQRLMYQSSLTSGLQRYAMRHKDIVQKLPGVDGSLLFEQDYISELRSVQEFDHHVIAPHFGFECVEDYYSAASTVDRMHHVQVPLLNIGAENDPITGEPPHLRRWEMVIQKNEKVVYVSMPSGGHLGFVGTPLDELRGKDEPSHSLVLHAAKSIVSKS